MLRYFHEKYILQNKKVTDKSGIVYVFTNFFNAWLNESQLDSHTSFCVQTDAIYCFGWSLWSKIQAYTDM